MTETAGPSFRARRLTRTWRPAADQLARLRAARAARSGCPRRSRVLLRHREADDAFVPVAIDCADAEEEVVLGDSLDGVARDVADLDRVLPVRCVGVPVDNLVTCEIGFRVRLPLELCVDIECRGLNLHPARCCRPV